MVLLNRMQLCGIVRHDRIDHRGGGVTTFIKRGIEYSELPNSRNEDVDIQVVDIIFSPQKYRFINVYRPPKYGEEER
jgi:hypothetical protein